jgi:large subunit ribosomal protein L24
MAKAARLHVRKNDQVVVISGKDRGKRGRVLEVYPGNGRALVEGVNIVQRHTKPNPQRNIKGGIASKEAPIHVSNVMLIDPEGGRPTRVGYRVEQDGTKTRIARRSGAALGALTREQERRGRGPAPSEPPAAAPARTPRKVAAKAAGKAAPRKAAPKKAVPKKAVPKKAVRRSAEK